MQEMVAIYRRVSTLRQVEDGVSLDAQKEKLEKLCEMNNYKIYKDYVDEGLSGKDTEHRPAFNEMMEDMRKGLFSKIIVLKIDRISRNIIDLENTINEMQKYKCDFESASEKIDTHSSMGMMFIRLLGIFAQFERERISERVKDALAYKLENNEVISFLPTGYKIQIDNEGKKRAVIDEEKKEIIIDLFKTYEKTNSLAKTSNYLKEKYPQYIKSNGFSTTAIKRIMSNTIYYGCFKGIENYCEPYFSKEYWEKVNDIRENKNIKGTRRHIYLFTGLVKGSCGHKFHGEAFNTRRKGINFHYGYRCSHNTDFGNCRRGIVLEHIIEQEILKNLSERLKIYISDVQTSLQYDKNLINKEKRILTLKKKKQNLIDSYIEGWITKKDAQLKINDIETQIINLEKTNSTKIEKLDMLKDLATMEWLDMYNELPREEKRDFYRKFLKTIYIDLEKYDETREDFITLEFI